MTLPLDPSISASDEDGRHSVAVRSEAAPPAAAPPFDIPGQRSDEHHRAVIDAALDAIISIDGDDRVVEFNPAAERIFGYRREDAVGRPLAELVVPPRHRERHLERVAEVVAGARPRLLGRRVELTAMRRDGNEFPIELAVAQTSSDPVRLTGFVRDITQQKQLEKRLRYEADHDPLTHLFNRRRFEVELAGHLRRSLRAGEHFALVMLNLDDLKMVNDTFGHRAGDAVLRRVATALAERLGDGRALARLGADEFAALLPGCRREDAEGRIEELLAGVSTKAEGLSVTASAGAAVFDPEAPATGADLLVAADIALHEAKQAGRAQLRFFSGREGSSVGWIAGVKRAVEEERLLLYSQPIVDARTRDPVREELLVRMRDETGEVVAPHEFLPLAERFGFVHEIDRWIVERAVALAAGGRSVAINLSARSFGDPALTGALEERLGELGVDPGRIVLEITETAAFAHLDEARGFAERVSRLGCRIALDDFGTGFGSFTYLKHLPVDELKIDMEFVRGLARDATDQRIVRAIVETARALGQRTVAEGVEDEATLAAAADLGVDYAQGYLFGRPRPVAAEPARAGVLDHPLTSNA